MRNSTPILLGNGEISALDESEYDTDEGAVREAVVQVGREHEFDGVQVLSEGTIFVQSVLGEGNDATYVYPVGAGVSLQHDYINGQDRFTPAAFLIYRTEIRIDPIQILPSDIVCCPLEANQLGRWLWSYWMIEQDTDLVVLDDSHPNWNRSDTGHNS